jgi:hypothetical protein
VPSCVCILTCERSGRGRPIEQCVLMPGPDMQRADGAGMADGKVLAGRIAGGAKAPEGASSAANSIAHTTSPSVCIRPRRQCVELSVCAIIRAAGLHGNQPPQPPCPRSLRHAHGHALGGVLVADVCGAHEARGTNSACRKDGCGTHEARVLCASRAGGCDVAVCSASVLRNARRVRNQAYGGEGRGRGQRSCGNIRLQFHGSACPSPSGGRRRGLAKPQCSSCPALWAQ